MQMFTTDILLGSDLDKRSRVETSEGLETVSVKEEVILEMTVNLIMAMLERKSNGLKTNDKALSYLVCAHNEFMKNKK